MTDKLRTWPRAATVLILLVYAISFGLPLFIDHVPPPGRQGLGFRPAGTYIIRGWQGFVAFFYLGYMIPVTGESGAMWSAAWLANPLLWYGLHSMLRGRNGRTLTAGVVATGLGLLALPACLEWDKRDPQFFPHSAYWTWLASMFLLAIAGAVFPFQQQKPRLHRSDQHNSHPLPDPTTHQPRARMRAAQTGEG